VSLFDVAVGKRIALAVAQLARAPFHADSVALLRKQLVLGTGCRDSVLVELEEVVSCGGQPPL
jgi:hypothetical protein